MSATTPHRTRETTKARHSSQQYSSRIRRERSYRQMIGRIDVWSVLKVSLCFHTGAMLVTIIAMIACWAVAKAVGLVKNFEKFLGTIFGIDHFSFANLQILTGTILIGLVLVALMTVLSVLAAMFYNIFAEAVGGVEVYVVEETAGTKL